MNCDYYIAIVVLSFHFVFNYFPFAPNKAVKPLRDSGLLGVEELEAETLLSSKKKKRSIRGTLDSD